MVVKFPLLCGICPINTGLVWDTLWLSEPKVRLLALFQIKPLYAKKLTESSGFGSIQASKSLGSFKRVQTSNTTFKNLKREGWWDWGRVSHSVSGYINNEFRKLGQKRYGLIVWN
jgi:hypothetical protein